MSRPTLRRVLAITAVAAAAFVAGGREASAHANLSSSDPAAGATLAAAPAAVTLTFTEDPEPSLAVIRVLDRSGGEVEAGKPGPVQGDPRSLTVPLGSVPDGVYTVSWRVVSKADGHATAGAFAFGVGEAPGVSGPPAGQPSTPPPSPLEMAGRWAFLVGLVAALGAAMGSLVVFRGRRPGLLSLAGGGTVVAAVGLVGLTAAQRMAAGVGFGVLARTAVGHALFWRGLAVADLAVSLAIARRPDPRWWRAGMWAAALASIGAMLAEVASGHAGGAPTSPWAEVLLQWTHFVAVGVWIGGLAALFVGVRGAPTDDKAVAVRRFSALALFAVAVVGATGVLRAVNEVGTWGSLFSSSYGLVVSAKVALLLVLVGLGAANRYRSVPVAAANLGRLRRVSRVELSVAGVALAATAVLTSLSPPAPAAEAMAPSATSVVATGSDFTTSVRFRLEVEPGVAGPNRFRLTVRDFDTGAPVEAGRVSLRFAFRGVQSVGESSLDLEPDGDGVYQGDGTNLSLDGIWTITVLVQRGTDSFEVPLEVPTACRAELLSAGPPPIYVSKLAGGASVQQYVDPGKQGQNEVHFTYFDSTGGELPIEGLPAITAWGPEETPFQLDVRRFSPGHFVARGQLGPGKWRFDASASAQAGTLSACFQETIAR